MKKARILFIFVCLASTGLNVFTQITTSSINSSSSEMSKKGAYLSVSEVREGMRGKARTVFQGTEPEEFDVEILGLVPGAIGPKQDLIIGRISGGKADRTAVFAGMSGSPVYVDGKLIGAISYSFPFSKEAICGITPIEQMLTIFEQSTTNKRIASEPGALSFTQFASASFSTSLDAVTNASDRVIATTDPGSRLSVVADQAFRPIGTPLTFSGISQTTLDRFSPQLIQAGLLPVASVGGRAPVGPMKAADNNTLVGGDSVSMQLTRGDISLAAAGTVTLREGDKIYAFGHPFLSLGSSDLPMSESSVVTVIPNVNNSFKLAVPRDMVGSMTQDRATGVFGKLGKAPTMIPVRLNFENSRGNKDLLQFEVARDDFLTPLLLNIAVFNSLTSQERSIGEATVVVNGSIRIKGQDALVIDRRFAGGQATMLAANSIALPVSALLRNNFGDLEIQGIELDLKMTDGSKTASLERLAVDRVRVKAGETVEVTAFARTSYGRVVMQKIPVVIPEDVSPGTVTLSIADGMSVQKSDASQFFVPNDLNDLVSTLNRLKVADRLYLRLLKTTSGVVIGSDELPNLPPSVLATLSTERMTASSKAATQSVVFESTLAPSEYLISGEQTLTLTVVK